MSWITATELEQWADRLDSQSTLPAVVRLAIHGSGVQVREVDFPAGDSVTYPGLDGYLVADGISPFVPAGTSVWEVGTSGEVRDKANGDYRKRTHVQELGIDRSQATFVFVTSRRWPRADKENWIAGKRADGIWRDVRVIDADMLEQWLERAEAAAIWAAERAGFRPVEMLRSVEEEWAIWRSRFEPRATERLVLAGRDEQAKDLVARLTGGPCPPVTIEAHSPDEARAFAAADILTAGDARIPLLARSVVVTEPAARLGRLRHLRGYVILLPDTGPARDHATALTDAGNHVVLGIGNEAPGAGGITIKLARTAYNPFVEALVDMGLSTEQAHRATLECGRSATVLRRRRPSSVFPRPVWAEPEKGGALVPAMLAGGWDQAREGDRRALGQLAGTDYASFTAAVTPWCNIPDPPIRRVENVWHVAAPADACALLVPHLTSSNLDQFAGVVGEVLGEDDPKLDLLPDERVFADIRGKTFPHSGWLRGGLVRTLLLLAVGRFAGVEAAETGHERCAGAIVEALLRRPGWRPWASLDRHLPSLAEASPEAFLRALERQLEGDDAREFAGIFSEGKGLLSPTSHHVGLLWALETLAWSPRYLRRVCLALARLASIDPGGKLTNRPLASLRDILLPWRPGTNAGAVQRRSALDAVLEAEPDVGWKLLDKLLPRYHDSASPTHKPTWRDFGEAKRQVFTRGIVSDFRREVVARFLARIGDDPERWATLFDALGVAFDPGDRARVPELLDAFAAGPASPDAKQTVWARARDFVGEHRRFRDADWSLPEPELARIEQAASTLAPVDPVERVAWLFDSYRPAVPTESDDHEEREAKIAAERIRALHGVRQLLGDEGILGLIKRAKFPGVVAWAIPEAFVEMGYTEALLDRMRAADTQLQYVAGVLSARAAQVFGATWRDRLVARAGAEAWPPDVIGECLRAWPDEAETWNVAESLGEEAKHAYWSKKDGFPARGLTVEERIRTAREYAEVGRALTAIDVLSDCAAGMPAPVLADLLERGYEELAGKSDPRALTHLRYDIQLLFKALHGAPDADEPTVARLEYRFLPVLEDGPSGSLVLHKLLAADPAFFVEVLGHVFKPASGDEEEATAGDRERIARRAEMSWHLLESWRRLPGADEEGSINGEKLLAWVGQARAAAATADRAEMADRQIGRLLAHVPVDADGAWPHRAARRVLEEFDIEAMDEALVIERFNIRGRAGFVGGRGGDQERTYAAEARGWAETIEAEWPRTAIVLEKISDMWEHDAKREDIRQAQRDLA